MFVKARAKHSHHDIDTVGPESVARRPNVDRGGGAHPTPRLQNEPRAGLLATGAGPAARVPPALAPGHRSHGSCKHAAAAAASAATTAATTAAAGAAAHDLTVSAAAAGHAAPGLSCKHAAAPPKPGSGPGSATAEPTTEPTASWTTAAVATTATAAKPTTVAEPATAGSDSRATRRDAGFRPSGLAGRKCLQQPCARRSQNDDD